ncbi:MAG: NRDE family protein [Gammaproteobacteria bacterium]|nr:NRDE family protein [Gammaproteobacteria bacterium]
MRAPGFEFPIRLLDADEVSEAGLFSILEQREPVAGDPAAGAIRLTPFVLGDTYGTRSSTVIMIDQARQCRFVERRFDAQGRLTGESRVEFTLG